MSESSPLSTTKWVLTGSVVIAVVLFNGAFLLRLDSADMTSKTHLNDRTKASVFVNEPIAPLPRNIDLDSGKVALGKRLFEDPRLSRDNSISCSTCHDLNKGGGDGLAGSRGIGGALSAFNAPTVFNSSFNFRQFWDGRAATLEEQTSGPVHNPTEMGSSWQEVVAKLSADPEYTRSFTALYPKGLSETAIQDAIATFERSLITPDARIDRYLRGEQGVLNERELAGYRLFKERGCTACHQGINIGGNLFQSMGVFGNFFADRAKDKKEDQGRFNVTGKEEDRHLFKVPSLRNVARTAPYLHDGSIPVLGDAVKTMGKYQLGRDLPPDEIDLIVAFLHTLTGTYQGKPL
jgi:cytochrome c peroxidase